MNQPSYLSTLTPLRGIAALLVLVFHSSIFLLPLEGTQETHLIQNGFLWVDFFFVLSGFILSYVYGSYFRKTLTQEALRKYVLARFSRIYPLHLVTLIWAAAMAIYINYKATSLFDPIKIILDYKAVPASLLLIQSMHTYLTPPLNTPSWSLSTEWWMYMLFPLLVRPFFRLSTVGKAISFLGITALYLVLMYVIAPRFGNLLFMPGRVTIDVTADFGFVRCMAGFLLGMLLHQGYRTKWGCRTLHSSGSFIMVFGAVLAAMHYNLHELLIVSLFPLVILSAAYNTGYIKALLNTRVLQRLGDWSFSIYMVHIPIVYGIYAWQLQENTNVLGKFPLAITSISPDFLPGWSMCLLWTVLTLAVAAATYNLVEVPARNYLNARFKRQSELVAA